MIPKFNKTELAEYQHNLRERMAGTERPFRRGKLKRWRSPQRSDAAVVKPTKSEAIAWFKKLLGVGKLPDGFEIESF